MYDARCITCVVGGGGGGGIGGSNGFNGGQSGDGVFSPFICSDVVVVLILLTFVSICVSIVV